MSGTRALSHGRGRSEGGRGAAPESMSFQRSGGFGFGFRRSSHFGRCRAVGDYFVAGDIGGTNARFELWRQGAERAGTMELVVKKKYPTADHATFVDALIQFDSDCKATASEFAAPRSSAFAVAGVVVDHKLCDMTNLHWKVDADEVADRLQWPSTVLNDFEAVGYGVLAVSQEDTHVLHDGAFSATGPKVVLGPGTGFGQAQLFWGEGGYTVMPSEGAHGDFGARGAKQRRLSAFVESRKGYCELEHVCCGPGLENIHDFLLRDGGLSEVEAQARRRTAPEISEAAIKGSDDLCVEAAELLLTILGQEAGNWGLRSLARGGVYIAGGVSHALPPYRVEMNARTDRLSLSLSASCQITPKLLPILENGCLKRAFLHEDSRFSKVIDSIPLTLITTDDIGLAGAAFYASRDLG